MQSPARSGRGFRHVFASLLVACLVAVCLGAGAIDAWAQRLPDQPFVPRLQDAAARWNTLMRQAGVTAPYDWIRAGERRVEHVRFAPPPD